MPRSFGVFIVWLHLLGAVVWIGGLTFQVLVVVPALTRLTVTAEWLQLSLRLERQFRYVMWPAVGVVLLTGLYNVLNLLYAISFAGRSVPPTFVRFLGLKLVLVGLMLVLQGVQRLVLYPRTVALLIRLPAEATILPSEVVKLRRLSHLCQAVTVSLAVVVMLLGVMLRG
jgi:putative copper resistance protein D